MELLGIDIGFGGCKYAHGNGADAVVGLLPVGAAPIANLVRSPDSNQPVLGRGKRVVINGVEWGAGVDPLSIERFGRNLSDDYPRSEGYYALFLAVLATLRVNRIDHLVTGLPVNHHQVEAMREGLRRRLTGEHLVDASGRRVTVDRVTVVPQPTGAYMEAMRRSRLPGAQIQKITDNQLVCVLDPGHYSVDWILLRNGATLLRSSGSCAQGSKEVLKAAAARISTVTGSRVSAERIDQALRSGEKVLSVGTTDLVLAPHVEAAAAPIVEQVVLRVRNALEAEDDGVDVAVLSGGGAPLYLAAVARALPRSKVWMLDDPVTANAQGFYLLAVGRARRAIAA